MSDQAEKNPAYLLWVELATRVATQPLHYRAGDEESAAHSIQALVPLTRELLAKHPGEGEFRETALHMLNVVLRPATTRWRGWMTEDRSRAPDRDGKPALVFRDAVVRQLFREELYRLRPILAGVKAELAALARVDDNASRVVPPEATLGGRVHAGVGRQVSIAPLPEGVDPTQTKSPIDFINAADRRHIVERRRARGVAADQAPAEGPIPNATGLALSGGGIRSATYCLGLVQVLVRQGLFAEFDYLSTVSGGGYLGSFLSCALGTNAAEPDATSVEKKVAPPPSATTAVPNADSATLAARRAREKAPQDHSIQERLDSIFQSTAAGTESGTLRHLRNNSKYLLNGGFWTRVNIGCLLVAGILWSLMLVTWIPLGVALVALKLEEYFNFWGGLAQHPFPFSFSNAGAAGWFLVWSLGAAGLALVALPAVQRATQGAGLRSKAFALRKAVTACGLVAAMIALLGGAIYCQPALWFLFEKVRGWLANNPIAALQHASVWGAPAASGAAAVILGVLSAWIGAHRRILRGIVAQLFLLSGPVFFLSVYLMVANRLGLGRAIAAEPEWSAGGVLAVAAALLAWGYFAVNLNTIAPHLYYRAKLCECYLARRRRTPVDPFSRFRKIRRWWTGHEQAGHVETLLRLPLAELNSNLAAPFHLINTTVNLPASDSQELRGREGDFFCITRDYCGAPTVGYRTTQSLVDVDPHLDLGTAMAISGAAASTSMGWQSLPNFRFVLTLLNIRLGYWLPWRNSARWKPPGLGYFLREMTASFDEHCDFLNLSDGGHQENLATYELLRRRCKFIVCVDAGQEPGMECADLTRLQRYAQIDLGIQFEYSIADLSLQPNGFSRAPAILVKVIYPPSVDELTARLAEAQEEWTRRRGETERKIAALPQGEAGWEQKERLETERRHLELEAKQIAAFAEKKTATPPECLAKRYPALGWLLYVKLAVTGVEPVYVLDYRRENPAFPHQSTGDQFYDEAQFEAYRRLGVCAAESLFREELFRDGQPESLEAWFQGLANNMLSDNDPVFRSPEAALAAGGATAATGHPPKGH